MITLLDGRSVAEDDFAFEERIYHFTLFSTGEDVTNLVRRSDKLALVPGFDVDKENWRLSVEKPATGGGRPANPSDLEPLPTSTAGIFADQILNDPIGATLETLDAGVNKLVSSSGVRTIAVVAVLVIAAAIYFKKS